MSTIMATTMVNGFAPAAPDSSDEVSEYEKILKLRDEIFAGIHPRLKVPAHVVKRVSPLSASSASAPTSLTTSEQPLQVPGLSMTAATDAQQRSIDQNVNSNLTILQSKPTTASSIDPVLLMKSDELVKAEIQLHRQRLERALREQFEQKRLDARKKPAAGEAKPDFDIATILSKAREVVKPEGASTPKEDASESGSYDENSLYSSRAPDSTPEIGELEDGLEPQAQSQSSSANNAAANGPTEPRARAVLDDQVQSSTAILNAPSTYVQKPPAATDLSMADNEDDDEEEEEGEYSPPEATGQENNTGDSGSHPVVDFRARTLRRYSELDEHGKASAMSADLSRMNPRLRGNRPNQRGRAGSPHQSPEGSSQGLHPRKKRRLDKKIDRRKRGGSADVKDEPVSPPPFHDVQPLGSSRMRAPANDRPIIIDDGPVREARYVTVPEVYLSSPMQPIARQGEPFSEPRVVSRSAVRPLRDDTDLRRVVSMQNMRAEQPREYLEPMYESPTRARAASYIRVDSPMRVEPPRIAQELPPTYDRRPDSSIKVLRSPEPTYREAYPGPELEARYIPEPMPPPVLERIVVDQYGRRFRQIIQDRSSVAPRTYSAYPDQGQSAYYESFDRGRNQSTLVETRQDFRPGQEMLPPQVIRQATEAGPAYREVYEPLPPSRSVSVRPIEQPPRTTVFQDEYLEYRPSARIASVRPPATRFEEMGPPPSTVVPRAGSAMPIGREGSMYFEERPQVRREYLPIETPQYCVVEAESRYLDPQGREITYVNSGQQAVPRFVQRY